jgi:hypothetical protein
MTEHLADVSSLSSLSYSCFQKLAQDIAHELPQYGSVQATAARIKVKNARHLVLDGSRWNKYAVVDWLQQKGF